MQTEMRPRRGVGQHSDSGEPARRCRATVIASPLAPGMRQTDKQRRAEVNKSDYRTERRINVARKRCSSVIEASCPPFLRVPHDLVCVIVRFARREHDRTRKKTLRSNTSCPTTDPLAQLATLINPFTTTDCLVSTSHPARPILAASFTEQRHGSYNSQRAKFCHSREGH